MNNVIPLGIFKLAKDMAEKTCEEEMKELIIGAIEVGQNNPAASSEELFKVYFDN